MHTCMHLGLSSRSKIHNDTNFEHHHCLLSICPTQLYTLYTWCTVPQQILKQSVRIEAFFEFHYHTWFYKFVLSRKGYESWRIQDSWQPLAWSIIPLTSLLHPPSPTPHQGKICESCYWPVIFDFVSSITFNNSSLQVQTFLKVISWNWEPESNKTAPAVVQLLAHEETLITAYIPKYCDIHKKKLTTLKECQNSLTCQAGRASNDTQTTVTHMDLISKNPIIYENCPRAIGNGVQ
jgi:hypothetical protein